jgi:hypothetical protein
MTDLSDAIKEHCNKVAADPAVQISILEALLDGCERGTDLWEAMENDYEHFQRDTCILLWGAIRPNTDSEERDDVFYNGGLCDMVNPYDVINYLVDKVEENIKKAINAQ